MPTFAAVQALERDKNQLLFHADMTVQETTRQARLEHAMLLLSEAEKEHAYAKLNDGKGLSQEAAKEERAHCGERRVELLLSCPEAIEGSIHGQPPIQGNKDEDGGDPIVPMKLDEKLRLKRESSGSSSTRPPRRSLLASLILLQAPFRRRPLRLTSLVREPRSPRSSWPSWTTRSPYIGATR